MKQTKEHLTFEGFSTILTYYAAINKGVSSKVTKYYPPARGAGTPRASGPLGANIKAADRPNIKLPLTLNPNRVSGFAAGDGGFSINIRNNRVEFRFHVAQHSKDFDLLKLFISFFNSPPPGETVLPRGRVMFI